MGNKWPWAGRVLLLRSRGWVDLINKICRSHFSQGGDKGLSREAADSQTSSPTPCAVHALIGGEHGPSPVTAHRGEWRPYFSGCEPQSSVLKLGSARKSGLRGQAGLIHLF